MATTSQSLARILAETDDATAAMILQLELENERGTFEPLQQVLADTDEATAALMLQLQIEDSQSAADTINVPFEADFLNAKASWARELRHLQSHRRPNALLQQPAPVTTPAPTPPPPPVRLFDCNGACAGSYPAERCVRSPCGDHYCHSCLDDLFRLAMADQSAYPPRCCRQPIPFEGVRNILSSELAEEFAAKKPELDDPKPTYCYVPTCSTYIGKDNKDGKKLWK
jgi:hypothetical protein